MFVEVVVVALTVSIVYTNPIVERAVDQSKICLAEHNRLRALHLNTPNLVLDSALTASAQKWADYLQNSNTFVHSKAKGYGENLYYSSGYPAGSDCVRASNSWYSEIKSYSYNNPTFSSRTGHFTQLVWKSSTKVGFGISFKGSSVIVVAQYSPAGNVLSQFKQNVMPKK
ncbi:uncharacterized protein LOC100200105 isoform X1 [Hydra vulgaris]|uniref:uncharacterized protein LOC100200105 isoform X1 n=1 Tax=Hydra vulgaris TaxID=6087 RepID=UPI0001926F64|nr:protein PRY1 [Hydra vulgaris]